MKITLDKVTSIDLAGKTIAFSTDTVFGVGALPNDVEAINSIYEMKGRDRNKPLAMLFSKLEDLKEFVDVSDDLLVKMSQFWPGAITFIVPKRPEVKLQPQFKTIGIRQPDSLVAKTVLDTFGPMAVTSVNKSGEETASTVDEIIKFPIDYVVLETEESSQTASTVVDLTTMTILREGQISRKELGETFPLIHKSK